MREGAPPEAPIPRWLRFVLASDRAGSAWYIGTGFFLAPVLAVLSPWPAVTAVRACCGLRDCPVEIYFPPREKLLR